MATSTDNNATPIALGPDSLAWTHAGDNLQLLMAGTTLLLQVSHPVVGAGVGDHSVFKEDPWGRLKRTTDWGLRLMYGGEQGSVQAGRDLRELHRTIKGADEKGRKYFALDPEAYAWVHMTTYYTMVTTQRLFGDQPFTASQEAQLLQEWVQQGRVLGIRDQDMPHTVPAFCDYFHHMVGTRLENTDTARYLLDVSLSRVKKPPQLVLMPAWLWKRLYRQVGKSAKLTTYATLPPALRKTLHVHWTGRLSRRFERQRRAIKNLARLVPPKVRYLPPAYLAVTGQLERFQPVIREAA